MKRTRWLAWLILLPAACAPPATIDRTPLPAGPPAGSGGGAVVRLQRLAAEVPADTTVGRACIDECLITRPLRYAEARRALSTSDLASAFDAEMRGAQYAVTAVGAGTSETDDGAGLPIAAVVSRMKANFRYGVGWGNSGIAAEIELGVRWVLFDRAAGRVVREFETTGTGNVPDLTPNGDRKAAAMAFIGATRGLLADAQFVVLAANAPRPQLGTDEAPTLERAGPLPGASEQRIAQAQAGAVAVRVGEQRTSGFVLSRSGWVVTASFGLARGAAASVRLADGNEIAGTVISVDRQRRLGLLKLTHPVATALPVSDAEHPVNTDILLLGAPTADPTRGVVTAYRTIDDVRYIQSNLLVRPDAVGAAVVDRTGEVIGIAIGGAVTGSGGSSYIVPITDAIRALRVTLVSAR